MFEPRCSRCGMRLKRTSLNVLECTPCQLDVEKWKKDEKEKKDRDSRILDFENKLKQGS